MSTPGSDTIGAAEGAPDALVEAVGFA